MTFNTARINTAHDMERHPERYQHPALEATPTEVFVVVAYDRYHNKQPLAAFDTPEKANQWMDANSAVRDEFMYDFQVIPTCFNPTGSDS